MALLVDRHQPLVDRHYGNGSFASRVMGGLQEECDRLGCKIVRTWKEERKLRRKVSVKQLFLHTSDHKQSPALLSGRYQPRVPLHFSRNTVIKSEQGGLRESSKIIYTRRGSLLKCQAVGARDERRRYFGTKGAGSDAR